MRVKAGCKHVIQQRDGIEAYIHVIDPALAAQNRPEREPVKADVDMTELAERCQSLHAIGVASAALGLPSWSLRDFCIGWSGDHRAFTFPMRRRPGGPVVGIRLRADGRKWSVTGGREGLFIPTSYKPRWGVVIEEGPTNAAALKSLGFNAVGRPSCLGGVPDLARLCAGVDVVICAQRDKADRNGRRAGQRGAGILFKALRGKAKSIRVIMPPRGFKDARDLLLAGWTRSDFVKLIRAAQPLSHPESSGPIS